MNPLNGDEDSDDDSMGMMMVSQGRCSLSHDDYNGGDDPHKDLPVQTIKRETKGREIVSLGANQRRLVESCLIIMVMIMIQQLFG